MPTIFLEILFWKCEQSLFCEIQSQLKILCLFCLVFIFLNSREEQTKNNINLTSYFWAYLPLNDSGHYQKSKIKTFSSKDENFPVLRIFKKKKNVPHAYREFQNLHSQNTLSNDHILEVCVLSQTDYFEWNKFSVCEFLICFYKPIY